MSQENALFSDQDLVKLGLASGYYIDDEGEIVSVEEEQKIQEILTILQDLPSTELEKFLSKPSNAEKVVYVIHKVMKEEWVRWVMYTIAYMAQWSFSISVAQGRLLPEINGDVFVGYMILQYLAFLLIIGHDASFAIQGLDNLRQGRTFFEEYLGPTEEVYKAVQEMRLRRLISRTPTQQDKFAFHQALENLSLNNDSEVADEHTQKEPGTQSEQNS